MKTMSDSIRRASGIILAVVFFVSPWIGVDPAFSQSTDVRAVTFDLGTINGTLEILDEQRLSIRLEDGSTRSLSPDEIAFIEFTETLDKSEPDGELSNGLLQLVDGTRYTGWSDVVDGRFVWLNWWSGTIRPDVDNIVFFGREGAPTREEQDKTEDLALLVNGDRMTGLVLDITDKVELERADSSLASIPIDRIECLSLVNPINEESGVRVWLTRGDEVIIDSFRLDAGTGLRIPGREPLMPSYLYALAFDFDRITPLADQPSRSMGLIDFDRYRVPDPSVKHGVWPLDAPPIDLKGPLRVEWDLPEEGMGFTTSASIPARSRRHGDFEVSFFDGDEKVKSIRMNESSPSVNVTLLLETRRLSIEINETTMGPVQNHLRLDRALLIHPEK